MRAREYCYKAMDEKNPEYIVYIGNPCGTWYVFVTNEAHTFNYSVYGGYKNIGTASNRLKRMASGHNANKWYYASKYLIEKNGAFGMKE